MTGVLVNVPTCALAKKLCDGMAAFSLTLPAEAADKLLGYVGLLSKWNAAYNLTAVRDPEQMLVKHVLDSLSILPHVPAGAVIDIGTGGGLPGLVLAVAHPGQRIVLLDSNGKKARFLRQAIVELNVTNAEVVQSRVEAFTERFEVVTSRAFATLADMVRGSEQLLVEGGEFLAMKGQRPDVEIAALPAGFVVREVIVLRVPFLNEERHLVRLARG
jgi:16S rRNA (guanine527-N7)-methyltransferase